MDVPTSAAAGCTDRVVAAVIASRHVATNLVARQFLALMMKLARGASRALPSSRDGVPRIEARDRTWSRVDPRIGLVRPEYQLSVWIVPLWLILIVASLVMITAPLSSAES